MIWEGYIEERIMERRVPVKAELRKLSVMDGKEVYEMIVEIGLGEGHDEWNWKATDADRTASSEK